MTEVDRAYCRAAARECVHQALIVADVEKKEILLARAQEWLRLAYAKGDAEFERLLAEFNLRQMEIEPAPPRRQPVHRQPMQQQQHKKADDK